jgi:hypothetical protein
MAAKTFITLARAETLMGLAGVACLIEPSYDLRVDGATSDVLAAATEFGKRHAQEVSLT